MFRLYDSSVWIDFRKGISSPQTDQLDHDLLFNQVCICPIIIQEVLQGVRLDREFRQLKVDFLRLDVLAWDATEAAVSSAELYRFLRQRGTTIRKPNDCLIASFALHFEVELCHNDRDFDLIAAHTSLKIWKG